MFVCGSEFGSKVDAKVRSSPHSSWVPFQRDKLGIEDLQFWDILTFLDLLLAFLRVLFFQLGDIVLDEVFVVFLQRHACTESYIDTGIHLSLQCDVRVTFYIGLQLECAVLVDLLLNCDHCWERLFLAVIDLACNSHFALFEDSSSLESDWPRNTDSSKRLTRE